MENLETLENWFRDIMILLMINLMRCLFHFHINNSYLCLFTENENLISDSSDNTEVTTISDKGHNEK